jgi:DNA repair exonuclease SbcCD ATPase subunit
MSQFRRLLIENFQSHAHTELDFVPGLNVLVGPSDSGKSAILRALRWVLFNTPRGTEFIREGAEQCRVVLTLNDGTEIERIRGRKKALNRYILRRADGSEEVLESLGVGPHPLVVEAHGIQPFASQDAYVQVGTQLEPPFLLSESGSNKAKWIGRISGAHWIDQALKGVSKDRHQLQAELRHLQQQEAALEEKLQPYENVPALEEQMTRLEQIYVEMQQKRAYVQALRRLHERWQKVQTEKEEQTKQLSTLSSVPELERRYANSESKWMTILQWRQLQERQQSLWSQKQGWQQKLEALIHLPQAEAIWQQLGHRFERFRALQRLYEQYVSWQQQSTECRQRLQETVQLPQAEACYQEQAQRLERLVKLLRLHNSYRQLQQVRQEVLQKLELTAQVGAGWAQVVASEEKQGQIQRLQDLYQRYQQIQDRLRRGRVYLSENQQKLEKETEQYVQLLERLGRCPTCGASIHEVSLEHILG